MFGLGVRGGQVTHFEFSNESNVMSYNGHATAAQYAAALLDWGPRLKAIKPDLLLGANGCGGRSEHSSAEPDPWVCYWELVRPGLPRPPTRLDPAQGSARAWCIKAQSGDGRVRLRHSQQAIQRQAG